MRKNYPHWRKARRSEAGAECVEIALATDHQTVGVRDSKENGRGQILEFTRPEWAALLTTVRGS
ncbi:DUF397 domain-containing protein [Actinomadura sp. 7K507]|uniref:DUF397 domain-containing protein n=1 Tax=Actinomadura sp. 7K507 TaxID=2530365 RepID=UPI00104B5E96|nr:DUF397 domain-containing protein [Actinomadura sp. 7K507]TDC97712.1 DUF397 domain-containing protein [Actinomadura sp. 7K507]